MATSVTPSLPIRQALDRSEPLARLSERLRESRQRFDAIAPLLPESLRAHVRPGPVDTAAWTLLADNGAIAAKLRQMVPALQARLGSQAWPALTLRIKVLAAD